MSYAAVKLGYDIKEDSSYGMKLISHAQKNHFHVEKHMQVFMCMLLLRVINQNWNANNPV